MLGLGEGWKTVLSSPGCLKKQLKFSRLQSERFLVCECVCVSRETCAEEGKEGGDSPDGFCSVGHLQEERKEQGREELVGIDRDEGSSGQRSATGAGNTRMLCPLSACISVLSAAPGKK